MNSFGKTLYKTHRLLIILTAVCLFSGNAFAAASCKAVFARGVQVTSTRIIQSGSNNSAFENGVDGATYIFPGNVKWETTNTGLRTKVLKAEATNDVALHISGNVKANEGLELLGAFGNPSRYHQSQLAFDPFVPIRVDGKLEYF